MTYSTKSLNPSELFHYLGDTSEIWAALIGQVVTHFIYETGRIVAIEKGSNVRIVFDRPYEGKSERLFLKTTFQSGHYFTEITVPTFLLEQLQLNREKERRREEEAEAAQDFARLQEKFDVSGYEDKSPLSPLYKILLQLEEGAALDQQEINWLKVKKLYSPLAHYYEKEFRRTNAPWLLAKAASHWRKNGSPWKAIVLTTGFHSKDQPALAAVVTSRGGAFRDLKELDEAETCAMQAIDCNPNAYHPFNLLGAVYYQKGYPEQGDVYFEKAAKLGAPPESRDDEIRVAVIGATETIRRRVAKYLLQKDPIRYKWAQYYLQ